MDKQFWMVWCVNGRAPQQKHLHQSTAIIEAERLATKHPGDVFAVLEAIAIRQVDAMRRIDFHKDESVDF